MAKQSDKVVTTVEIAKNETQVVSIDWTDWINSYNQQTGSSLTADSVTWTNDLSGSVTLSGESFASNKATVTLLANTDYGCGYIKCQLTTSGSPKPIAVVKIDFLDFDC